MSRPGESAQCRVSVLLSAAFLGASIALHNAVLLAQEETGAATSATPEILDVDEIVHQADAVLQHWRSQPADAELVRQQTQLIESLRQLLQSQSSVPDPLPMSENAASVPEMKIPEAVSSALNDAATAGASEAPIGVVPTGNREALSDSVWGHLPQHEREELYRTFNERYLPQYERALSDYFRALAEQPVPVKE